MEHATINKPDSFKWQRWRVYFSMQNATSYNSDHRSAGVAITSQGLALLRLFFGSFNVTIPARVMLLRPAAADFAFNHALNGALHPERHIHMDQNGVNEHNRGRRVD